MSESITKVGVVTQITEEVKQKKNGTGTFKVYNLFVDEKKYGLGYKKDLVTSAGIVVGDTVRVVIVKNGDFWNVDSLEKVDPAATPGPAPRTTTGTPKSAASDSVQLQIVRQSALKLAVSLVVPFATDARRKTVMSLDQQLGKVVAFADHLVRYVETGKCETGNEGDGAKLKEEGAE